MNPRSRPFPIRRYAGGVPGPPQDDEVTLEEPLEIRVEGRSVAVTMRTPGDDEDLALGFLVTEGIIRSAADVFELTACPSAAGDRAGNVIDVLLRDASDLDWNRLSRHVYTSSSCGLCGKATLDNLFVDHAPVPPGFQVDPALLPRLPDRLRAAQPTFQRTGGLHASALFSTAGDLLLLREDVGRHNALDKVIGHACRHGLLPLRDRLLLVSGRISFELVQKALVAGIPAVAGISAPSSLAIQCADRAGQLLVGFLRGDSFNAYAHPERLQAPLHG